jgi:membrane associated rhomboid family serine protease
MANEALSELKREIKTVINILIISLSLIWGIFIINMLFLHGYLNSFGIHPRTLFGLIGILTAPLLHLNLSHIIGNSIAFLLFATLVLSLDIHRFITVTVFSTVIAGFGTWLIGMQNSNHIGASGIIMGYFGYCISIGFIEKKIFTIIFSIIIILSYGGMIFSVLPFQLGISWEGHLFGFLGGIIAALFIEKVKNKKKPL